MSDRKKGPRDVSSRTDSRVWKTHQRRPIDVTSPIKSFPLGQDSEMSSPVQQQQFKLPMAKKDKEPKFLPN